MFRQAVCGFTRLSWVNMLFADNSFEWVDFTRKGYILDEIREMAPRTQKKNTSMSIYLTIRIMPLLHSRSVTIHCELQLWYCEVSDKSYLNWKCASGNSDTTKYYLVSIEYRKKLISQELLNNLLLFKQLISKNFGLLMHYDFFLLNHEYSLSSHPNWTTVQLSKNWQLCLRETSFRSCCRVCPLLNGTLFVLPVPAGLPPSSANPL